MRAFGDWIGAGSFAALWLCLLGHARAAGPEIWFAPEDVVKRVARHDPGTCDYMQLFAEDAPWPTAAGHVQVFELSPQFVGRSTDDQLRAVINAMAKRKIALAYGVGLLHKQKAGKHHEGLGADEALTGLTRIKQLGGTVLYIAADEPLWFGHFYNGPGAVPVPIADLARDMAGTAKACRQIFPGIRICMDDPIMAYDSQDQWNSAMKELLTDYRAAMGEPMQCVRLENVGHSAREWLPRFVAARALLKSQGVDFGILVTGDARDPSDAVWLDKAQERYETWESQGRTAPEQVVFQSWMPCPTHALPESSPLSFTHLLDGYFRDRTAVTAERTANSVDGRLTDASGQPIGGAHLTLSILPALDDPTMVHRIIKGVVPPDATTAGIGLRIGIEGSPLGTVGLKLGATHYSEAGDPARTVEVHFPRSVTGLSKGGTATVKWDADNQTLDINARSGQTLSLNTNPILVTAGREFEFNIDVHLQPQTDTGYLAIHFFDASHHEIVRLKEMLASETPQEVAQLTTDAQGDWQASTQPPALHNAREIRINYAGDDRRRPALASVP